jgi:hypothetical protein
MDLREIRWNIMDWIHVAEDKDRWRVIVYMVINLLMGSSRVAERLVASQKGLLSMELV